MQRLSEDREQLFWEEIAYICKNSRVEESKKYYQHGNTSVYQHSLRVTYASCLFAQKYNLPVDYRALIRGAFLHDYFLYDWHDKEHKHKRPHGFYHPRAALNNALEDFDLSKKEKNIILRHMFPLTLVPPVCLEAWIVCFIDKVCSTKETFQSRQGNENITTNLF